MRRTVVINAVGLTPDLLGPHTPRLSAFVAAGKLATVTPTIPAVTCAAQSTYLTGVWPNEHGIVANGWYFADECEIKFWRQSNKLVQHRKVWEVARELDPSFTCANLFWWYNMYSSADYTVTPRPMYPADGRKLPDVYTQPADLRPALQKRFGQFPLFNFWGPEHLDRGHALDRQRGQMGRGAPPPDAHPRLPAPPRLQPAAHRRQPIRRSPPTCGSWTTSSATFSTPITRRARR